MVLFFCKQKTAYEMRISDWSSDVCSSDLCTRPLGHAQPRPARRRVGCRTGRGRRAEPRRSQDPARATAFFALLRCDRGSAVRVEAAPRHAVERPPCAREGADPAPGAPDFTVQARKSVVEGTGGAVRVDLGGERAL